MIRTVSCTETLQVYPDARRLHISIEVSADGQEIPDLAAGFVILDKTTAVDDPVGPSLAPVTPHPTDIEQYQWHRALPTESKGVPRLV